jgi:hypothetical protein
MTLTRDTASRAELVLHAAWTSSKLRARARALTPDNAAHSLAIGTYVPSKQPTRQDQARPGKHHPPHSRHPRFAPHLRRSALAAAAASWLSRQFTGRTPRDDGCARGRHDTHAAALGARTAIAPAPAIPSDYAARRNYGAPPPRHPRIEVTALTACRICDSGSNHIAPAIYPTHTPAPNASTLNPSGTSGAR